MCVIIDFGLFLHQKPLRNEGITSLGFKWWPKQRDVLSPEAALSWLRHSSSHELLYHGIFGIHQLELNWIPTLLERVGWADCWGWGKHGMIRNVEPVFVEQSFVASNHWYFRPAWLCTCHEKGFARVWHSKFSAGGGKYPYPTLRDWERHPSMLRWFSLQGPRVGLVDCEALNLEHPHISSDGGADSAHTQYVNMQPKMGWIMLKHWLLLGIGGIPDLFSLCLIGSKCVWISTMGDIPIHQ